MKRVVSVFLKSLAVSIIFLAFCGVVKFWYLAYYIGLGKMLVVCIVGFSFYEVQDRMENDILRQYSFRLGNKIMNAVELLSFALFLIFVALLPSDWFVFPVEATLESFVGLGAFLS